MARSVELILSQGLPAFLCGGYYTRALPMQYLMAGLTLLGANLEFVARYIAAASSIAALPAVYLIGRRVGGTRAALVGLLLCSLSLWQIEFGRFGRMYAPFQAVFLWYVYFFLLDLQSGKLKHGLPRVILSITGALLWEGGIFLMALNLVPPFVRARKAPVFETLLAGILLAVNFAYLEYPFRFMNQPPVRPPDMVTGPSGTGWTPGELTILLSSAPAGWVLAFLVVAAPAVFVTLRNARAQQWPGRVKLFAAAIVALAALNQIAILIPIALSGLLFLRNELNGRSFLRALVVPVVSLSAFWFLYALWSRGVPLIVRGEPVTAAKEVLRPLLAFPSYLHYLARPWWESVPHLTLAIGSLTGLSFILRGQASTDALRILQGTLLLLIVLVAYSMTGYQMVTRYSFFLLPILYILGSVNLVYLLSARWRPLSWPAAAGLVLLIGLMTSEDFRARHMATIASYETNFRMGFDSALEMHYYPRFDYRSPAQYVNEQADSDDLIISTDQVFGFYLNRLDYVYHDVEANNFRDLACNYGQRDRWTNAPLFYRQDMILEAIERHPGTVWLLIRSPAYSYVKPWEAPLRERFAAGLVFTSPDERLSVYRITPSP